MKKINLGQSASILTNIGVIAGIIFLAIEISQNTEMMQSQTRDALTSKQMDFYMAIGMNEHANELISGAREGTSAYGDDSSKLQAYAFIMMANFRMWENEWYQYQKGLYEEDEFLARSSLWFEVMTQSPVREQWEQRRNSFAPDFREYIDKTLID
jgi:hypothetical protein